MNYAMDVLRWFTGGEHQYMRLWGCMKGDTFWITVTITLDLAIAAGYVIIASHWGRNQRNLPDVPAKRALSNMRNIFIFCGLCGYIFIPIKMFWPAWRLYDFALLVLVYFTWRYALTASNLKVVYSELGRSSKLAADLERMRQESHRKSQFLNALSHDLRTPLNGLALQTRLAEMCLQQGDQTALQKALADIRASTMATAALLDGLLECGRADWDDVTNHPTRFALDELLTDVAIRLDSLATAKSIFLRVGSARGAMLHTDRSKLDRILTNLISNSLKFTNEGGVHIEVDRSANGVEIHVIDSGVGIPAAEHERLFDEFFQVQNHERDPSKGFGLGLSIARRLAMQLGGDITVDSAPGRGSRFSVVLPEVLAGAISSAGSAVVHEQRSAAAPDPVAEV